MFHSIFTLMKLCFLVMCFVIAFGCALFAGNPHDNFIAHLNAQIGKNIDEIPYYEWPFERDLIQTKELANGNIEKKYKYRGTCKYIFEIDPKIRKIVGARFEGKDSDCYINP